MARRCTIPCDIGGVERRIRSRALGDTLAPNLPALGAAVLLFLASPVLIPVAGWQVALVAAIFFLLAASVLAARALLQAGEFTRLGVPAELDRIIDEHEGEIHPPRVPSLRAQAARLRYDTEQYRLRVTQFLQELREATGEAWRCPCRKRRLPIPLPF
jgi:cell division protein FtsW (lipid II flippase)